MRIGTQRRRSLEPPSFGPFKVISRNDKSVQVDFEGRRNVQQLCETCFYFSRGTSIKYSYAITVEKPEKSQCYRWVHFLWRVFKVVFLLLLLFFFCSIFCTALWNQLIYEYNLQYFYGKLFTKTLCSTFLYIYFDYIRDEFITSLNYIYHSMIYTCISSQVLIFNRTWPL